MEEDEYIAKYMEWRNETLYQLWERRNNIVLDNPNSEELEIIDYLIEFKEEEEIFINKQLAELYELDWEDDYE